MKEKQNKHWVTLYIKYRKKNLTTQNVLREFLSLGESTEDEIEIQYTSIIEELEETNSNPPLKMKKTI